ncbi:MAG TPA: DUF2628 domain-containing protein [Polyangiales bacterium]|nr:DUF2628 domain-containing protein [Polyangiales bacterium]
MAQPDLRDPEQWIPRELFAAYCGANSEKLLQYYDKAKAKRKPMLFAFDWLAFFVLPAWLGYRRQWTLWGTLVGMIALITIIAAVAKVELPAGAFGGGLIALGMMAQGLLLAQANGLYFKLKKQSLGDDAMRVALADKASPSVGMVVAGLAGALIIQALVVFVLPD